MEDDREWEVDVDVPVRTTYRVRAATAVSARGKVKAALLTKENPLPFPIQESVGGKPRVGGVRERP